MRITQKIFINTVTQLIGKGFTFFLSFLSIILLTRYLGVSGYGNFSLVFTYLSFFSFLSDMGLGLLIVRDTSNNQLVIKESINIYITIKLILTFIAIIAGLITLLFFPYSAEMKISIMIGSVAVIIGSFTGFGTSLLQARLRMDLVTIVDQITKIFTVMFIAIFIWLKLNFFFIITTVIIGNLVGFGTTLFFVKREFKFTILINWHLRKFFSLNKNILKDSFLFGLMTLFAFTYFKVDSLILSIYKTSSELGVYALAYKIVENILLMWGFYMASIYPLFSKYIKENSAVCYKYFINSIILALFFSSICIYFGFFRSSMVIKLFGGSNFIGSTIPFKILTLSLPFFLINNIFYHLFISSNKIKQIIISLILALVVNLIINLIYVPKYSYIATSYTTLITEIFLFFSYIFILFRNKLFINK